MKFELSYDLEDPEEMYEFSRDCAEVYCNSYQDYWNLIDFDGDRNNVSPADLFKFYHVRYQDNTSKQQLLSDEAKSTFRRYAIIEDECCPDEAGTIGVLDRRTGKELSHKPKQIFTFCKKEEE